MLSEEHDGQLSKFRIAEGRVVAMVGVLEKMHHSLIKFMDRMDLIKVLVVKVTTFLPQLDRHHILKECTEHGTSTGRMWV